MERLSVNKDAVSSHSILRSLYTIASGGSIPTPGTYIRTVKEFTDGSGIQLSCAVNNRVLINVKENNGTSIAFGITKAGLVDLSYCYGEGMHESINDTDLNDKEEQDNFRALSSKITNIISFKTSFNETKPLPNGVQEFIEKFLLD